jgi:hypothetical protein
MLTVETIGRIRREHFIKGKRSRRLALTLRHAPVADCARYDNLRRTETDFWKILERPPGITEGRFS